MIVWIFGESKALEKSNKLVLVFRRTTRSPRIQNSGKILKRFDPMEKRTEINNLRIRSAWRIEVFLKY